MRKSKTLTLIKRLDMLSVTLQERHVNREQDGKVFFFWPLDALGQEAPHVEDRGAFTVIFFEPDAYHP